MHTQTKGYRVIINDNGKLIVRRNVLFDEAKTSRAVTNELFVAEEPHQIHYNRQLPSSSDSILGGDDDHELELLADMDDVDDAAYEHERDSDYVDEADESKIDST